MHADRKTLGAVRRLAVLATLAWPGFAGAQSLTGYVQSQYQIIDQSVVLRSGLTERQRVERWVQTFEVQHFATPRSDLRVLSSFRISDLSYRGLSDQSRSPQGSIQVTHPWVSMFAAYRPTTVTGGLGRLGFVGTSDSGNTRTLTSRAQEAIFNGNISPPSWPRLDVSWLRRHRNPDELSPEETGVTRNAHLSWANERMNVYGMLGDQRNERSGVVFGSTQRTAGAGGALHFAPLVRSSADVVYDLADARVGDPLRNSGSARTHNATFNFGYRPNLLNTWSGSWLWRRAESRGPHGLLTEDHEGALQCSVDPSGPFRFIAASGVRTLRRVNGARTFANSLSGVASLDGRVRPNWNGVATLTHVTNWEPGRGHWSVEAMRAGSQMRLNRGFDVSADAQVSTSDDTTLRNVNTTTEANLRARLSPWHAFTTGWTARLSRSGDRLLNAGAGAAHSTGWDVLWRPVRSLELTGVVSSAQNRASRSTTRTAGMRWAASSRVQLVADWSRSSDSRELLGIQSSAEREIATAHVVAAITRKLQLDASAGVTDRGGPRESRLGTVTMTWAFGR